VARTKDSYQLSGNSIPEITNRLNFFLARISERLDRIEGLRGNLETQAGTFDGDITANSDVLVNDEDGALIHSLE
jgi:hypothetical protein